MHAGNSYNNAHKPRKPPFPALSALCRYPTLPHPKKPLKMASNCDFGNLPRRRGAATRRATGSNGHPTPPL
nr:MAG TPA: hypothetical protein [Caudoviricetes sp.]